MRVNISKEPDIKQDCVEQQLTSFDISLRRQIGRNVSRTKNHASFEIVQPMQQGAYKRDTFRNSWAETSIDQGEKIGQSCINGVQNNGYRQKKRPGKRSLLKHVQLSITPHKKSQNVSKTKIKVSLLSKNSSISSSNITKKSNTDINSTANGKDIHPFQMDNTNIILGKQHKPFEEQLVQKIKQPHFHNKHPLYERILSNGACLSKMIAERALQPKPKPFLSIKLPSQ